MSRLTPNEQRQKAEDELQDEVVKTHALLEILAVIPRLLRDDSIPGVGIITLSGLEMLAREHGRRLHASFQELVSLDEVCAASQAASTKKTPRRRERA